MHAGATISEDGVYRYRLTRWWGADGEPHAGLCGFVMLNPSTADASLDDPTIRRCVGFARRWGYGGILVVNLFAFRATQPSDLLLVEDPIGPENDEHLAFAARTCDLLIAGWGTKARWKGQPRRDVHVVSALNAARPPGASRPLMCLRKTVKGYPEHPLYLPGSLDPIPYGDPPKLARG